MFQRVTNVVRGRDDSALSPLPQMSRWDASSFGHNFGRTYQFD
jgi:hypothetical protein